MPLLEQTKTRRHGGAAAGTTRKPPQSISRIDKRDRRMSLLKRAGLFGTDTRGAIIRRAVSAEDLAAAYALVHQAFLERGYIRPEPGGLRVRVFEALPTMATFVAEADGQIVGVQSLAVDDPDLGLPSDMAFQDAINVLRRGGRLVCEATNQAIAPEYRKSAVATELMRAMFAHALHVGCDELITTVSPGHARFYELLGFEKASPIRSYSADLDDPTLVMRVNVSQLIETVKDADDRSDGGALFIKLRCLKANNNYCRHVAEWDDRAREVFADPAALHDLFAARAGLLYRLTEDQRRAIRRQWGADVFDAAYRMADTVLAANRAPHPTGSRVQAGTPSRRGVSRTVRVPSSRTCAHSRGPSRTESPRTGCTREP